MQQAANLTNQFNNQFPVANLWNTRYQNALMKLNRLAPKGQNVRSEVISLTRQNLIPQNALVNVNNLIIGGIPNALNVQTAYPQHLNLLILNKVQLEGQLGQAANLQNQLTTTSSLTPQQRQALQTQLSECQNAASALQPQYLAQK